jgi:hypothetical protein
MLKLNAGFSRKVGEPDFGSRGASVNVELELDSNLIRDSEAFGAQIRNLFDLARQSVDEELAVDRTHPADSRSTRSTGQKNGRRENGSAENHNRANGNSVRHATSSQLRAIRAICERLNRDPAAVRQSALPRQPHRGVDPAGGEQPDRRTQINRRQRPAERRQPLIRSTIAPPQRRRPPPPRSPSDRQPIPLRVLPPN